MAAPYAWSQRPAVVRASTCAGQSARRTHPDLQRTSMAPRADNRTILLVEDNADDRARIHRMLRGQRRKYKIMDCSTGSEALDLLRRTEPPFDCVLLDHFLPDMTGEDV